MTISRTARVAILGAAVVAAAGAVAAYALRPESSGDVVAATAGPVIAETTPPSLATAPRLIRVTAGPAHRGDIAVSTGADTAVRVPMTCSRVHATTSVGACVRNVTGVLSSTTYELELFDASYRSVAKHRSPGIASRVRVSAGSKYVAVTSFVQGHSYGGTFSTQTLIYDARTAKPVGDLELFAMQRDGRPERSPNRNLWGVTFVDDDRFYATLGIGSDRLLVKGTVSGRSMETLPFTVECPSLSPDGTRIAFKQKPLYPSGDQWHLAVLELSSGTITKLPSKVSIDDQAMWLDDDTITYAVPNYYTWVAMPDSQRAIVPMDTMAVAANGKSSPRLLVGGSESLVAVR